MDDPASDWAWITAHVGPFTGEYILRIQGTVYPSARGVDDPVSDWAWITAQVGHRSLVNIICEY